MRHILLYVSGLLFFHAMPPLVAARPALAELPLPPHLTMYASAALVAVLALRSQWMMQASTLVVTLLGLSGAALVILSDHPLALLAGFLTIGATVPVLMRFAFEDAAQRARPVGSMLGFASFFLEGMAFSMGVLVTFLSTSAAHLVLALVPVLALVWVRRSADPLPRPRAAPRLHIGLTLQDVIPAVAANSAFFLFLSGVSMAGAQVNPMQIGSAIAITAIGFASGAFLSDRIRVHLSDRFSLVAFSLCGLASGLLGTVFSLQDYPALIYVIAIGISLSNGVIISTALSSKRLQNDQEAGLPGDNALVFLIASGVVAVLFSLAAAQFTHSAVWLPIVLTYTVAIVAALVQRVHDTAQPDLGHQQ